MTEVRDIRPVVRLRRVEDRDLDVLFDHQADPQAVEMAAFPARDRDQFAAHWAMLRADDTKIVRTIDDVVASLVFHYLEDWSGPLTELHRTLKPGGRLILAVNHPVIRPVVHPDEDYFAISSYTEDHVFDGQTVYLTFWHPPLHAMSEAFTQAGQGASRRATSYGA